MTDTYPTLGPSSVAHTTEEGVRALTGYPPDYDRCTALPEGAPPVLPDPV